MGNRIIRIFSIFLLSNFIASAQGLPQSQSDENKPESRYFGPHHSLKVDKEKRNLWILAASEKNSELGSTQVTKVISPVLIDLPDFHQVSYRIHHQGKIKFSNDEEIVILTHSAHENPEIGDVVMAFANDGSIYINKGHVCGGMIHFISHSLSIPPDKDEFFQHFFSDTDDEKWKIADISLLLKKK